MSKTNKLKFKEKTEKQRWVRQKPNECHCCFEQSNQQLAIIKKYAKHDISTESDWMDVLRYYSS
jgi:hypothetical protein